MAPPLRTGDDVDAMFRRLRDGTLDVVSTDHCGYTREMKQAENWWDSEFGVNGLQTALPVFYDEAINERGFPYTFLVEKKCTNPARLFGLTEKGTLSPGTDADIVVFDPSREFVVDASNNASKADYSVFEGRAVTGAVETTIVRGEVVADSGRIVGSPGHGEFVPRSIPDWTD